MDGVRVLSVYDDSRKIKHLSFLDCIVTLEYDDGIPENAMDQIRNLFDREEILVEKKGKNGIVEQNIRPMIRWLSLEAVSDGELEIRSRVCCQNPSLNPMQLSAAITKYLPELAPDFVRCHRVEIFDTNETVFR